MRKRNLSAIKTFNARKCTNKNMKAIFSFDKRRKHFCLFLWLLCIRFGFADATFVGGHRKKCPFSVAAVNCSVNNFFPVLDLVHWRAREQLGGSLFSCNVY
jgi:hypothetical protein